MQSLGTIARSGTAKFAEVEILITAGTTAMHAYCFLPPLRHMHEGLAVGPRATAEVDCNTYCRTEFAYCCMHRVYILLNIGP